MKQKRICDIQESTLEGSSKPYQTSELATYILESKGATSAEATMSSREILESYHELQAKHKNVIYIPDNSVLTYLSLISSNEDYPIKCHGRKKGYFLDLEFFTRESEEKETIVQRDPKESEMYPLLVSWLATEGYEKVKDISTNKGMGKWANPDVVGIRTLDIFRNTMMEIVTIEAKRDVQNWRHDIFEAVAHTMFADRSYYAYLCKESDKMDKQMVNYAQKFKIGILAVIVPDDQWGQALSSEDVIFREIVPAPMQETNPEIRKKFLLSLGIYDFDSYKQFAINPLKEQKI